MRERRMRLDTRNFTLSDHDDFDEEYGDEGCRGHLLSDIGLQEVVYSPTTLSSPVMLNVKKKLKKQRK